MDTKMEKETFLNNYEREFQTTLRVLKAYPADRQDYKPHEKSKSAKDLAWMFVAEEKVAITGVVEGNIDFSKMAPAPAMFKDIISAYEKSHKDVLSKLKNMTPEQLDGKLKFPVAKGKMMDFRKIDLLWFFLMDAIHHRGQMSVYIRLAGGKVPSIYGPTADEPW